MKLNGFVGKGSGKLGSSVFAISGGEQIVREYNPKVTNPSTDRQVEQRAKFKLLSQLGASLAGVIAIKKTGLVSARNQFVSINYPSVSYEDDLAEILLSKIQLTNSSKPLPGLVAPTPVQGSGTVQLSAAPSVELEAVVYCIMKRDDSHKAELVEKLIITEAGVDNLYPGEFTAPEGDYYILAYGVIKGSGTTSRLFEDYTVDYADKTANLYVQSALVASAAGFTETKGIYVPNLV